MDGARLLILCATCTTPLHLGDGMCPRCGNLDPITVVKEEDDAELHGVGERR